MKLLIDSGNTRCKYAVADETGIQLVSHDQALKQFNLFDAVIFSDVSNSKELNDFLVLAKEQGVTAKEVVTEQQSFGVVSGYNDFKTLGVDRWLGVLAADLLFPNQVCVVVDAGTAITVDVIDHQKQHLGGWIVPGLHLMEQSIIDRAPKVFSNEAPILEPFGTSTPNALRSGVINMATGTVEKAIRLCSDMNNGSVRPKVILTGGDAALIGQNLEGEFELIDNLIFVGLNRF